MNTLNEWQGLGDAVKHIQDNITSLLQNKAIRGNRTRQRLVIDLIRQVSEFKSKLDNAAVSELFDTPYATSIFYREPLTGGVL